MTSNRAISHNARLYCSALLVPSSCSIPIKMDHVQGFFFVSLSRDACYLSSLSCEPGSLRSPCPLKWEVKTVLKFNVHRSQCLACVWCWVWVMDIHFNWVLLFPSHMKRYLWCSLVNDPMRLVVTLVGCVYLCVVAQCRVWLIEVKADWSREANYGCECLLSISKRGMWPRVSFSKLNGKVLVLGVNSSYYQSDQPHWRGARYIPFLWEFKSQLVSFPLLAALWLSSKKQECC